MNAMKLVFAIGCLGVLGCDLLGGEKDEKADANAQSLMQELKQKLAISEKKLEEQKVVQAPQAKEDEDTEQGALIDRNELIKKALISNEIKIDGAVRMPELIEALKDRAEMLNLRERDLARREQLLGDLEKATIIKTRDIEGLRKDVIELLEKLKGKYAETKKALEKQKMDDRERETRNSAIQAGKDVNLAVQRAVLTQQLKENREKMADEMRGVSKELADEREKRISHLVSTVKGMRPSAGAGLLTNMDERDAVSVLRQLGSRQAAALLGSMPPNKAAKLAEAMLGPKAPPAELFKTGRESGEGSK